MTLPETYPGKITPMSPRTTHKTANATTFQQAAKIAELQREKRLESIGPLAAKLCYMNSCSADNICIVSCMAVCPEVKYLKSASEILFREYWLSHPAIRVAQPADSFTHGAEGRN